MYDELYEAWRKETENTALGKLPAGFYSTIANYIAKLKEENRMLDKRTVKARLLKIETQNVRRMLRELARTRYRKITMLADRCEKAQPDTLTVEEEKIMSGISPLVETYQRFAKNLLQGRIVKFDAEYKREIAVLRFTKDVPAIIGFDMKSYGPFRVEDVASLPIENAKILVKQGLAEEVEVS